MATVQDQDAAHEIAWRAHGHYLACMGADLPNCPDIAALRSQALEIATAAAAHAEALDAGATAANDDQQPAATAPVAACA